MWYANKDIALNLDYITTITIVRMGSGDFTIRLFYENDNFIDIVKNVDKAKAKQYFLNLLEDIDNAKSQNDGVIYGLRLEDKEEYF